MENGLAGAYLSLGCIHQEQVTRNDSAIPASSGIQSGDGRRVGSERATHVAEAEGSFGELAAEVEPLALRHVGGKGASQDVNFLVRHDDGILNSEKLNPRKEEGVEPVWLVETPSLSNRDAETYFRSLPLLLRAQARDRPGRRAPRPGRRAQAGGVAAACPVRARRPRSRDLCGTLRRFSPRLNRVQNL